MRSRAKRNVVKATALLSALLFTLSILSTRFAHIEVGVFHPASDYRGSVRTASGGIGPSAGPPPESRSAGRSDNCPTPAEVRWAGSG